MMGRIRFNPGDTAWYVDIAAQQVIGVKIHSVSIKYEGDGGNAVIRANFLHTRVGEPLAIIVSVNQSVLFKYPFGAYSYLKEEVERDG
jgi:hypothetical protein